MTSTSITADLRFSLSADAGRPGGAAPSLSGSLQGNGSRLELQLSTLPAMSIRKGRAGLRQAAALASRSAVKLAVRTPAGVVLELGAGVRSGLADRLLLRTRFAHVVSWSAVLRARRADHDAPALIPLADLLPPATMWPLSPTFGVRRQGQRSGELGVQHSQRRHTHR